MLRRLFTIFIALIALAAFTMAARAQGTASVTLSWTAPGDDDWTGTATQYEIRFSTSPITAGNFASATLVPNPPAPLASGSAQAMLVGGVNEALERVGTAIHVRRGEQVDPVIAPVSSAGKLGHRQRLDGIYAQFPQPR